MTNPLQPIVKNPFAPTPPPPMSLNPKVPGNAEKQKEIDKYYKIPPRVYNPPSSGGVSGGERSAGPAIGGGDFGGGGYSNNVTLPGANLPSGGSVEYNILPGGKVTTSYSGGASPQIYLPPYLTNQPNQYPGGTRTDLYGSIPNTGDELQAGAYLKRDFVENYIDPNTGKVVPVYSNVKYVESMVDENGKVKTGLRQVRNATSAEENYYNSQTKVLQASTAKAPSVIERRGGDIVSQVSNDVYTFNKGAEQQLNSLGVTRGNIYKVFASSNIPLSMIDKQVADFVTNAETAFTYGFVEKPLNQALTFGIGAGIGAAYGLVAEDLPLVVKTGLSAFPGTAKLFGGLASGGAKAAGVIMLGSYGLNEASKIASAPDASTAGSIAGNELRDSLLTFSGFNLGLAGERTVSQYVKSKLPTLTGESRNTLAPYEKSTTPEVLSGVDRFLNLPKNQQLKAFQEGRFGLPGEGPGGYHTTPEIFYGSSGEIIPAPGSSELSGIYVSPGISPAFLKISSSYADFDIEKLIADFFSVKNPGISYLIPENFRVSEYSFSKTKIFEGQKYIKGKGYAYFKNPAKPGYLDLPLMKSEAEAVARADSSTDRYVLKSSRFYTTINNQRIPIDVFEYYKPGKSGAGEVFTEFNPERYTYPYSSATRIRFGFGSSLSSSDNFVSSIISSVSKSSSVSSSPNKPSYPSGSSGSSDFSGKSVSSIISSVSSLASPTSSKSSSSSSSSYLGGYQLPGWIPRAGKRRKQRRRFGSAYSVVAKRKGKFYSIATGLPRGRALFALSNVLTKSTRRTARVLETGGESLLPDIDYRPSPKIFREFRISKGRTIPTPNQFIVRKRQTLKTPEAVRDIQSFKTAKSIKNMDAMVFGMAKKRRR